MSTLLALWCLAGLPAWQVLSSTTRDLDPPGPGREQTASVVADVDRDGRADFFVAERTKAPSVVLYLRRDKGWTRLVVDDTHLTPEAGGAVMDVDGDGDLDLILGGDWQSDAIWWWENSAPNFEPNRPWTRRLIKNAGGRQHHDQVVGDFDGDGRPELVSWCQKARQLLLFRPPADPRGPDLWRQRTLYTWTDGPPREGLAAADIDQDGQLDIVGGGAWYKLLPDGTVKTTVIDATQANGRAEAGQIIAGGAPEVVFSPGDVDGSLAWYDTVDRGVTWRRHDLLTPFLHGHGLALGDVDADGHLDLLAAEMHTPGPAEACRTVLFYGDGTGLCQAQVVRRGVCGHEAKLADLDGDGRLDILIKPYTAGTPRLDVLLQVPSPGAPLAARP